MVKAVAECFTHIVNNVDIAGKSTCYLRYRICIKKPAREKQIQLGHNATTV